MYDEDDRIFHYRQSVNNSSLAAFQFLAVNVSTMASTDARGMVPLFAFPRREDVRQCFTREGLEERFQCLLEKEL